jgi:DNA mismatch endonuclease (patch repair protein)
MDVHDSETRSFNMSRIRSRNTRPETVLRALLSSNNLRGYRLNSKLPGRPDLVYSKARIAIFVDGCFWHGCPRCGDGRSPSSNKAYWNAKRAGNKERDKRNSQELRRLGWRVIRLWEHQVLKSPKLCLRRIKAALTK